MVRLKNVIEILTHVFDMQHKEEISEAAQLLQIVDLYSHKNQYLIFSYG
ncbi:hypothetical protein V4P56_03605 [Bartonella sp. B35(2025)]